MAVAGDERRRRRRGTGGTGAVEDGDERHRVGVAREALEAAAHELHRAATMAAAAARLGEERGLLGRGGNGEGKSEAEEGDLLFTDARAGGVVPRRAVATVRRRPRGGRVLSARQG